MATTKIPIVKLTFLAFCLNSAVDSREHTGITLDAVKQRIGDGTILEFLESRVGFLITSFLDMMDEDQRAELVTEWAELTETLREDRKAGIHNDGLCLLVAYCLEGIQRRIPD